MADRIFLVGAGDLGRGVVEIARRAGQTGWQHEIVGFVDDSVQASAVGDVPVLGDVAWLEATLHDDGGAVLITISNPAAKEKIDRRLRSAGTRYAQIAHPTAEIASSVTLGPGSIIGAGAVVAYDTVLGRHVVVNLNATIGHHVSIGDYSVVAPGANILGKVSIGARCQVHANAVLLPGIRIGADCIIGAGSVVIKDVEAGMTVFGNPARPVPVSR